MNYIVLDLEYNQAFDFQDQSVIANPHCPFEIIQIGALKLNEQYEITDHFNSLIHPQIYKRMHPYVMKLTKMKMADFQNAPFFDECFAQFIKFIGGEKHILCSWGKDDIKQLYRNIRFYNANDKRLTRHFIDVQKLASNQFETGGAMLGLKKAAELFQIQLDTPFHDAYNDALYAAKIFTALSDKNIQPEKINLRTLYNKKEPQKRSDIKGLIQFLEQKHQVKFQEKEMQLIKEVYYLGKYKKFN